MTLVLLSPSLLGNRNGDGGYVILFLLSNTSLSFRFVLSCSEVAYDAYKYILVSYRTEGKYAIICMTLVLLYNILFNQALLNTTGCNNHTFNIILSKFQPYYGYYTLDKKYGNIHKKIVLQMVTPDVGR